jgi:hypothetical protein
VPRRTAEGVGSGALGGATQTDRDRFRDLFAHIAPDPAWIRRVSQETTDAIHRELPELDVDEELRMATFASTQSVLVMMADLIGLDRPPSEGQLPPAAVGYACEFVQHGISIDTLRRAHHVGHSIFFGNWVTGCTSTPATRIGVRGQARR